MGESDREQTEDEIDCLRTALDVEARACLDIQRQLEQANAEFEEFISMAAHNPALQRRIFGEFKRLRGKEHPGNGLGLAFCKKAIVWQGGRIWVESTPGSGAKSYFTLPPAD